jgi:cytochrome b561
MEEKYGLPARLLHWLVALFVIFLIPAGLVMARLEPGATQNRLFVLHESFGVLALVLMIVRLLNRWRAPTAAAQCLSPTERVLSRAIHRGLYALLLATPIVGWLGLSAFGLGPSLFWLVEGPQLLAKNEVLAKQLFEIHLAGALLIAALATIHIGGAIRHLRRRDGVVTRMSLFARGR